MTSTEITETFSFFFYGTLCHPAILLRVLRRQPEGLRFQDAILPGYTRHHVKGEDYPAVIDGQSTRELLGDHNEDAEADVSTRGTLVEGLSFSDVHALDVFEGSQYTRRQLPILLAKQDTAASPIDATPTVSGRPLPLSSVARAGRGDASALEDSAGPSSDVTPLEAEIEVSAWVYVWSDDIRLLEPKIWDFQTFVQEKADVWTGATTTEYDDVERHHALSGDAQSFSRTHTAGVEEKKNSESVLEGQKKTGFPDFGHGMLQYWAFKQDYLNFNNGSYGSPPTPVIRAVRTISEECESRPDHFMKRAYLPLLHEARQRVAELIGAGMNEVVLVPGATHGMNNILREIDWADGDVILTYSTTYGAVAQTVKYLCDRNPPLSYEAINLDFPLSHAEIVKRTEETLDRWNLPAKPHYSGQAKPIGVDVHKRVRGLIIDQIASMPGMVFPMDDLIRLCKKYGVLSMVDAAHAIGQTTTDVKASDPDFWVSNCHKWLYAHRACAVLYVPMRNQGMIRSSLPTGYGYKCEKESTPKATHPVNFANQYDWVATQDWGPFLSINAALDFRKKIGGEERIMAYCHALAVAGGKRLQERWASRDSAMSGSVVMENAEGELTAAMLNVFLPNAVVPKDIEEISAQRIWMEDRLFEANAFCAVVNLPHELLSKRTESLTPQYLHNSKVCARLSCQVWNQLEDFDRIAGILEDALEGIRQGKHRKTPTTSEENRMSHIQEDVPVQDE